MNNFNVTNYVFEVKLYFFLNFAVWEPVPWRIFEIYRSTLILLLPFTIMSITYTKICIELWRMPNRRKLTEPVNTRFM